jgi:hypothetical protein
MVYFQLHKIKDLFTILVLPRLWKWSDSNQMARLPQANEINMHFYFSLWFCRFLSTQTRMEPSHDAVVAFYMQ